MKIYYRTSDSGYNKVKPPYVTNQNCLKNFLKEFGFDVDTNIDIICDNVSEATVKEIQECYTKNSFENGSLFRTNIGSSAGSFNFVLDRALKLNDNELVYFCENDYIHAPDACKVIQEPFEELNADYVTLYDHPDKYLPGYDWGEQTRVFNTKSCHWKLTISTTMTFAAKVSTLKEDESILKEFTVGGYPRDHDMFQALRKKGRVLVSPLPGYSTHGESAWLAPHRKWEHII